MCAENGVLGHVAAIGGKCRVGTRQNTAIGMATNGKQGGTADARAQSDCTQKEGVERHFHGCIKPARLYEYNGQKKTLAEWSDQYRCSQTSIKRRFVGHGTPEPFTKKELLAKNPPPKKYKSITWNGQTKTTAEWAREMGCSLHAMRCRILRHGTPEARHIVQPPTEMSDSSDSSDDPRANLYGFEGEWKTISEWAAEYGLTKKQCRRNFTLYGEPTKPHLVQEDSDCADNAEVQKVDKMLKEFAAKNNGKPKYKLTDILAEIDGNPSDGRPLREVLGVVDTFHLLDDLDP